MNRRGFLKFVGGAAIAVLGAQQAVARALRMPGVPHPYPYEAATAIPVGIDSPELLRRAIESLFPAGVRDVRRLYDETQHGFGLAPVKREGEAISVDRGAFTYTTFGFGYLRTGDAELERKLHRALFRAMWSAAYQLSQRPENRGAVLIWRRTPGLVRLWRSLEDHGLDDGLPMVTLSMRLALEQRGWRERLDVEPYMNVAGMKPEGHPVAMVS